jgi:hypothetical protein
MLVLLQVFVRLLKTAPERIIAFEGQSNVLASSSSDIYPCGRLGSDIGKPVDLDCLLLTGIAFGIPFLWIHFPVARNNWFDFRLSTLSFTV